MEIRPVIFMGNITTFLLESDVLPDKNPGIVVEVLDELATRGRFTWRNSFGIADTYNVPAGTTLDDMLEWSVWTYDISATIWSNSIQRVNEGVAFPEGFFDSSIILVGEQETSTSKLNVWSFLEPFTAGVWVMIAVTLVVSGLIYWWMERYNEDSDRQELGKTPTEPIYMAALSFTGEPTFQPSTDYARLFVLSLAFFCLLVGSAYTANLASFLVVQNTPSLRIEGVEDAVNRGLSMCVLKGATQQTVVAESHPGAKFVEVDAETDMFLGVKNGICDLALTSVGSWNRNRGKSLVNSDCSLTWVGRVYRFLNGGFATLSDSGTLCTNLIRDVLTLHLLEMTEDGFVQNAINRELESSWDINCDVISESSSSDGDDSSSKLGLQDTGGLFIVHYGVTALAIIMAVFTKKNGLRRARRLARKEERGILNGISPVPAEGEPSAVSLVASDGATEEQDSEQNLEAMYTRQTEQLASLSKEMTLMLEKLQSVQKESEKMREMIRPSGA
jgi:hypothetical protein